MAITVLPSIASSSARWIERLDLGIERRGRLVQHQDRRVLEERAGERDALPLAARQLDPALAQMRVIAGAALVVLQRQDEIVRLGPRRRRLDLGIGRVGPAVADVVAGRAVEHRGLLRDHRDLAAQALLGDLADVLAADDDAPRLDIVEPQQQRDERRLARARGADDADLLARRDLERDVADAALAPAIAEADIVEPDARRPAPARPRRAGRSADRHGTGSACRPRPRRHWRRCPSG